MLKIIAISALGGLALTAAMPSAGAAENAAQIKRGEYLAAIMDCGGCHTPGVFLGKPDMARRLAGSEVGFQIPGLGIFYPPNLTSDKETGLGNWSEADIIKAVTKGERPDGRVLAPAMPYHAYSSLNAADAKALAGYLKSLKPIVNQVPAPVGANGKASAPYLTVVAP